MDDLTAEVEKVPVVPPTPPTPTASLKVGDSGQRVAHLQNILNFWQWGNVGHADGKFGTRTKMAVEAMQLAIGAKPDGGYGPQTRAALIRFLTAMQGMS
jgi:N-acetylmuramoyl-L-alanine amidase